MAHYLNKRKGILSSCFAVLAIAVLVFVILVLVVSLLSGGGEPSPEQKESVDQSAGNMTPVTPGKDIVQDSEGFPGSFFTLSTQEAQTLWKDVRESEYVRINRAYETVIRNARFQYHESDDTLNAYASWAEEKQVRIPCVTLLGGYVRFCRLMSLAVALDDAGVASNSLRRLTRAMMERGFGKVSEQKAYELFEVAGLSVLTNVPQQADLMSTAREIEMGAILAALAHEAGHLAFGHGHRTSGVNDEITRNMEREADSFSFSVMCASSFRAQMMLGYLFDYGILAMRERAREATEGDHPLSQERIENLMRSNPRFKALVHANWNVIQELGLSAAHSEEDADDTNREE